MPTHTLIYHNTTHTRMCNNVINRILSQCIIQRDTVQIHAIAGLHCHHPLWTISPIDADPAMRTQANRGHSTPQICHFFVHLLVCQPLVLPILPSPRSQAWVISILFDRLLKHVVQGCAFFHHWWPIFRQF